MKSNYLVCYDIATPARLGRVFRLIKGVGIHLQYSVFYCSFTWPELKAIKEKLSVIIDPKEDDIRIYPLPSGGKVYVFGQGARIPDGVNIYMDGGKSPVDTLKKSSAAALTDDKIKGKGGGAKETKT